MNVNAILTVMSCLRKLHGELLINQECFLEEPFMQGLGCPSPPPPFIARLAVITELNGGLCLPSDYVNDFMTWLKI